MTWDAYVESERINRGPYKTYTLLYKDWANKNYWYEMLPEEDMLYIRIARFYEDSATSFVNFGKQLIDEISESGGIKKVVVDLRDNVGGLKLDGYERLFRILNMDEIDEVYALIDGGTCSRTVLVAYQIKANVDGSVLVGTPAGNGSSMFGHTATSEQTMPNCGVVYYIGTQMDVVDPNGAYEALIPDILVYPTIDDYKQGIDTILEAIKSN